MELYSCMFGFTWVYLWVCNYIYIYMCVCVCVCICVCAPVDVYMCVCVCAFSCASTALRGPTGVGCRSSLAWGRPKRTHQRCCLCSFSTTGRTGRLGFQTELPGHNTVQLLQRFFGSIFMFCHILVRSNIMTCQKLLLIHTVTNSLYKYLCSSMDHSYPDYITQYNTIWLGLVVDI